jgi:hypothetical protein
MNYVKYKGNKYPIFNTPLSNAEIQNLREKYDKFLLKDVRLGTIKLISNTVEIQRFHIDLGFKPMVYTTALVFTIYHFLSIKKKIKKMKPFSLHNDIPLEEWFKSMEKPNGSKPIEL